MLHSYVFFFFNDTATTEIYTLSLHDALPIYAACGREAHRVHGLRGGVARQHPRAELALLSLLQPALPHPDRRRPAHARVRSEEHTSELQSRQYLVCRLLLEKKKKKTHIRSIL